VKISTQIVLNQDELTEAVVAYVTAQGFVPEGASTEVGFDMGLSDGASSTVTIDAGEEAKDEKKSDTPAKPKATRAPRKPAAAAAEPVVEPVVLTEVLAKDELPWKEDQAEADAVEEEKELTGAKTAQEIPDAPKAAAPAIFANAKSSAAPETPKPSPVMSAKSLFANLTPPANQ
jgi:hypothetical protein